MEILVVGLWHLGSVISACLAKGKCVVTGWDLDPTVVERLSQGKAPLFEPGLDDLLAQGIQSGKLHFTSDLAAAASRADFVWIAFDTPVDAQDRADTAWVLDQSEKLLKHLKPGAGLIISSQLPVGSCAKIEAHLKAANGSNIRVCCSPENLRLGKALDVFQNPDRIVVGTRTPEDTTFFAPIFSAISPRIEWMRTESAEMTKHAINSFLATSIVFANELAVLCECVGADAREVERGLKTEARIGPKAYVKPGAAFAGGTLARDVQFLIQLSGDSGSTPLLLKAVLDSNRAHARWAQEKLQSHLAPLKRKRIAILGLTYKEGTDTLRRSWAIELATGLNQQGAIVQGFDWQLKQLPEELRPILSLKETLSQALQGCDAAVVGTDHPSLQTLSAGDIGSMRHPFLVDPNRTLERKLLDSLPAVDYCAVGFTLQRESVRVG